MKLKFGLIIFLCILNFGFSQKLSKDDFFKLVEKNSINLVKNKAYFNSLLEDQKSMNAWDSPYVEAESGFKKNQIGRQEVETTALFMVRPKLPWVQTLLSKTLKLQTIQYSKSYELYRNIAFIGAKNLYLTYYISKEKLHMFEQREANFLSQLQIAESKWKAGSMSKKDYISFKKSFYDAKLLRKQEQTKLLEYQRMLYQILGLKEIVETDVNFDNDFSDVLKDNRDIVVENLNIAYINITMERAKEMLKNSLYTEILDLQAKNYQTNAKIANRDRFKELELGGGVLQAESSIGATIRVSIPLPITTKNTHMKRKYLELHSGAIRENEITKNNLFIAADSYIDQLENKRQYIDLQRESIATKKDLVEMGRIAYESHKINLFEYLSYQTSYMDSLIDLANTTLEYIGLQAMLEETLGVMLGE